MTPPGSVSVADQAKLISYLQNGGSLYLESVNIAKDYASSSLNGYLGLTFMHDGNDNEVNVLYGNNQPLTEQLEMNYHGGTNAHYNVDRMNTFSGEMLFTCDGDFGRMVINEGENFKVVSSSVIMGAMANGYGLNLKPYLIGEMVNYFLGYDPTTGFNDLSLANHTISNFPNPFSSTTTIHFSVDEPGNVTVELFDAWSRKIKTLKQAFLIPGDYTVVWNATDESGNLVNSGIYYSKMAIGNTVKTNKMILVR
ncbi:MAG: T9SS type A sorting domain-containing protein [Bacteroidales bacterium]|nr:T9SS type A sorting domain-containing protein [Bacteroidales bacterium]